MSKKKKKKGKKEKENNYVKCMRKKLNNREHKEEESGGEGTGGGGTGGGTIVMRLASGGPRDELVLKIAKAAQMTNTQAGIALRAALDGIISSLKTGKRVSFTGFGTFSVAKRKARMGRNPQTGETIRIAAARVPKFKAGKALKDAVK